MAQQTLNESELRESLKRCPEATIQAAIAFQSSRDPALVPVIVLGIVERFVEPDVRPQLRDGDDSTRLVEDLAIDSLLMVEIVILVEETLQIKIENEELRNLRSLGDLKSYLDAKVQGLPIPSRGQPFNFADIAACMPQQPPFLFLQEARLQGDIAEGTYRISGDEVFLEGHFKDNPVFPASLMIEALGQLAVLQILKGDNSSFRSGEIDHNTVYFVSCDGVRCHKVCRPGEVLEMRIELKKIHAPLAQFEGSIYSGGQRVAKAEEITLTFSHKAAQMPEVAPEPNT